MELFLITKTRILRFNTFWKWTRVLGVYVNVKWNSFAENEVGNDDYNDTDACEFSMSKSSLEFRVMRRKLFEHSIVQ